jgi:hypothetical protein
MVSSNKASFCFKYKTCCWQKIYRLWQWTVLYLQTINEDFIDYLTRIIYTVIFKQFPVPYTMQVARFLCRYSTFPLSPPLIQIQQYLSHGDSYRQCSVFIGQLAISVAWWMANSSGCTISPNGWAMGGAVRITAFIQDSNENRSQRYSVTIH